MWSREDVRRGWKALDLDARDGFFWGGLALLAAGLYAVWPPGALIAPGVILVGVALFPPSPGRKRGG